MFAFAHTLFAPSMALALVILGFQLVHASKKVTYDTWNSLWVYKKSGCSKGAAPTDPRP